VQATQFTVTWESAPGLRYHVHRATKLGSPTAWQEIGVVVSAGATASFTDSSPSDMAFYAISVE